MSEAPAPVPGTWADVMGVRFVRASAEEVVAELDVTRKHVQAFGLVHGGVYCGLVESAASMGAVLATGNDGRTVVGLEHQTSFLRPVRSGTLRARATPLHVGKTTQLWQVEVRDEQDQLAASGRLRLLTQPRA